MKVTETIFFLESLEKEKQRLSNIMAYGEDVKPPSKAEMLEKIRQKNSRNLPKKDRFDESKY